MRNPIVQWSPRALDVVCSFTWGVKLTMVCLQVMVTDIFGSCVNGKQVVWCLRYPMFLWSFLSSYPRVRIVFLTLWQHEAQQSVDLLPLEFIPSTSQWLQRKLALQRFPRLLCVNLDSNVISSVDFHLLLFGGFVRGFSVPTEELLETHDARRAGSIQLDPSRKSFV